MKRISQFTVFILSTLVVLQTQADTWPQQEAGAESAGFSAEGIEALDDAMKVVVACIRELKRILGIPQARRPRKRRIELEWECPACIRGTGIHNHLVGPKRRRQKRGGE